MRFEPPPFFDGPPGMHDGPPGIYDDEGGPPDRPPEEAFDGPPPSRRGGGRFGPGRGGHNRPPPAEFEGDAAPGRPERRSRWGNFDDQREEYERLQQVRRFEDNINRGYRFFVNIFCISMLQYVY